MDSIIIFVINNLKNRILTDKEDMYNYACLMVEKILTHDTLPMF